MIRFRTQSGSSYEVDAETKKIRRVSGTHARLDQPLRRDGIWETYSEFFPLEVGRSLFVVLPRRRSPDGSPYTVITSPVVAIGGGT
jgi:hypothetical protein